MIRSKNKLILFLGIFAALLIGLNTYFNAELKNQLKPLSHAPSPSLIPVATEKEPAPPEKKKIRRQNKLIPEDPAKYGIISVPDPSRGMDAESYLNMQMRQQLEKSESTRQTKLSRKAFKKKIKSINRNIDVLKKKSQSNPSDKKLVKRLNSLYRLKTITEARQED